MVVRNRKKQGNADGNSVVDATSVENHPPQDDGSVDKGLEEAVFAKDSDAEMEEALEGLLMEEERSKRAQVTMKKMVRRNKVSGKVVDKKKVDGLTKAALTAFEDGNLDKVVSSLNKLSNYNMRVDDILALKQLWHSNSEDIDNSFVEFLLDNADRGLMSIHKVLEEEAAHDENLHDRDYVTLERILWTIPEFAQEFEDKEEICVDILVKHLQQPSFSSHDVCFAVIKFLHGIVDQKVCLSPPLLLQYCFFHFLSSHRAVDTPAHLPIPHLQTYIYADEIIPPDVQPKKSVVDAVRSAYKRNQIHPQESGGFIDFLEESVLPVDPSDKMVLSFEANTWEGQYDHVSETDKVIFGLGNGQLETPLLRKKLHKERLEGLRDHWRFLQKKKRAMTLGNTINKALIAFLLFFLVMAMHSYQQYMFNQEG
eukprot:m.50735 g.50735  ORF g.50735 m.50735 type:complete len:425 (-) comp7529_c0_seq2:1098-2372(-)